MKLRVATRSSLLALTQTRWVVSKLKEFDSTLEVEEVHITTKGDKILDRPLQSVGGKGLFVSEVEAQLVHEKADFAVHSVKDIPGDQEMAEGFDLVSVPEREDIRDTLVCFDADRVEDLKAHAVVGTSSLRRACQLRALRPDLQIKMLRGNVQTRLRKLEEGQYDAIVLAAAGLKRMGLWDENRDHVLDPSQFYPAIGQGALGLEAKRENVGLCEVLRKANCPEAWLLVMAERSFLKQIQGNCFTPIAGFAEIIEANTLSLRVMMGSEDGRTILRKTGKCTLHSENREQQAIDLGQDLAKAMIQDGAAEFISK